MAFWDSRNKAEWVFACWTWQVVMQGAFNVGQGRPAAYQDKERREVIAKEGGKK